MQLDPESCYAALRAHDARFDGRFFIAIASTGIYCRPICRVKTPRRESCTYHPSAASAEAAGFRPCLKCRPELAPGLSRADAVHATAQRAAMRMERGLADEDGLPGLADELGITDRHLRRVFAAEFGVAPVNYLQTRRLLLAKSLLTDTRLSVTEVALAAGFGSIRRFNALFKSRYRMAPTRFRKNGGAPEGGGDRITLFLGYRPPYAWDGILGFLAARAIPGVESVADGAYRRVVSLRAGGVARRGWIAVANRPDKASLAVTVASSLLPVLPGVLAGVRRLFDADCDPEAVYEGLAGLETVRPGIRVPGLRLPGCFDPFEMTVRAVLGQQISVAAARTLAARLAEHFGAPVDTPFPELRLAFPDPEAVLQLSTPIEARFGPLGVTGARSRTIRALAEALASGQLTLAPDCDMERETERLGTLPGVGPWTVQYLAMRVLGWPDAFPHSDLGIRKALEGVAANRALELSRDWRPWRAYAAMTLWQSLSAEAEQKEKKT